MFLFWRHLRKLNCDLHIECCLGGCVYAKVKWIYLFRRISVICCWFKHDYIHKRPRRTWSVVSSSTRIPQYSNVFEQFHWKHSNTIFHYLYWSTLQLFPGFEHDKVLLLYTLLHKLWGSIYQLSWWATCLCVNPSGTQNPVSTSISKSLPFFPAFLLSIKPVHHLCFCHSSTPIFRGCPCFTRADAWSLSLPSMMGSALFKIF